MIDLEPDRIAAAIGGATILEGRDGGAPHRAVIDSRGIEPGDLFFGLPGASIDGARFAPSAIEAGAWGAVIGAEGAEHRDRALAAAPPPGAPAPWIFSTPDPLAALQALSREWRREIGCPLVGITGSTGKTSVKDITGALLEGRVHASPENFNTEVGVPLTLLAAPPETEILVVEMAMRGAGQIAELCAIAEPDVAAITNVGPVHLELLGTIEAIAAAKAEILAGLRPGGRAVVPAAAPALRPHLDDSIPTLSFGLDGEVFAARSEVRDGRTKASVVSPGREAPVEFDFPFDQAHNLSNALCALAIGITLGQPLQGMAGRAAGIGFSRLRGEKVRLKDGILLLNDCYNANPISMRAAIDDLAARDGERRVAILGGMAELGPDGPGYHAEVSALARARGIDLVAGVGEPARDYSPDLWAADPDAAAELLAAELRPGDVVLLKASRAVGLERLTEALRARLGEEDDE